MRHSERRQAEIHHVLIVIPILFAAVAVGLCAPRITPKVWLGLLVWILFIIGVAYVKFQGQH